MQNLFSFDDYGLRMMQQPGQVRARLLLARGACLLYRRRIHANGRAYGTVHHYEGRTAPGTDRAPVHIERLLAHGAQDSHDDGHIGWQTPSHDSVNGDFLRRDGALPYPL